MIPSVDDPKTWRKKRKPYVPNHAWRTCPGCGSIDARLAGASVIPPSKRMSCWQHHDFKLHCAECDAEWETRCVLAKGLEPYD